MTTTNDQPVEATTQLQRRLRKRHLRMIAFGSAIGTGLFLTSGSSVQTAGPVVLIGYMIAGAVIFLMMRMLGEMAVARPVAGSFSTYASEYIGKWAGFVTGWNWWFTCIVVGMLELTAAGIYVNFWFPTFPHWLTALIALVAITLINLINVRTFGEFEFWFSLIKVAAVVGMIILGIALILGVGTVHPIGLSNLWAHGGFAPHGIGGFMLSLVVVTFTFGGVESIGTAAGEAEDPAHSIPKAFNGVLWRILIFYVGAISIMLILWPWDRIGLKGSPFVLILAGLGVVGAATILNVVVLTACLSVYNTVSYSGARMLHGLAEKGQAPRVFFRTNRRGVPVFALLVNAAFTGLVVLLNYVAPSQLLLALIAVILGNEIITWSSISISHLRFRNAMEKTGERSTYRSPLYPWSNYLILAFFALLVVLMIITPQFLSGAIALLIWITILLAAALINRAVRRKENVEAATVPAPHFTAVQESGIAE